MAGILVVTHGRLAEALVEAAGMISGGTNGIRAVNFLPDEGMEGLDAKVRSVVAEMNLADGLLCLVDLAGGTPARVVTGLVAEHSNIEVIAGVNLPMLMEVLLLREGQSAAELARHAMAVASDSIVNLGELFRSEIAM